MKREFAKRKSPCSDGIWPQAHMCLHCNCEKQFRLGECVIVDSGHAEFCGMKVCEMCQEMYCVDCGKIVGLMPLGIGFYS